MSADALFAPGSLIAIHWHRRNKIPRNEVTPLSLIVAKWRCPLVRRHVWEAPIIEMVRRAKRRPNTLCPFCQAKKANVTKHNNAAQRYPWVAREWHPRNPLGPEHYLPSSTTYVFWRCERGHEWQDTVHHRVIMGSGCPRCDRG
ncbi:MAG: zinc-ribbon domain-containing protein [Deltaproteobacteria bacterium]|nr:zinc-ribbon domain-containing protein [Deltaproteobacteria bacterium]